MACCLWQDKSIEEIDKLRCAFFWKGEKSVKGGQCLVAWKTVLLQKQQQGLGIKDLRAHNTALVLKLGNKVLTGSDDPMANWFRKRYLQNSTIQLQPRTSDTPTWKLIMSHFQILSSTTQVKIGDGKTTLFWKDKWLAQRLESAYPILFSYAVNTECMVQSQFQQNSWKIQLHPNLSYQAESDLETLWHILQDITPILEVTDTREILYPAPKISTANAYHYWLTMDPFGNRLTTSGSTQSHIIAKSSYGWHSKIDWTLKPIWSKRTGMTPPHCNICPALEPTDHILLVQECKQPMEEIGFTTASQKVRASPTFIQAIMDRNHSTSGIEPVESIST